MIDSRNFSRARRDETAGQTLLLLLLQQQQLVVAVAPLWTTKRPWWDTPLLLDEAGLSCDRQLTPLVPPRSRLSASDAWTCSARPGVT